MACKMAASMLGSHFGIFINLLIYLFRDTPFQLVCWAVNSFRPLPNNFDKYLILFTQEVFLANTCYVNFDKIIIDNI